MGKKKKRQNKARNRHGLQAVTLCISTAMVLILLGLVVLTGLVGHNLSSRVKENLVVTMLLDQDMTDNEAQQIQKAGAFVIMCGCICHYLFADTPCNNARKRQSGRAGRY